ncbi:MAG: 2-hydroxychromene-2-carboxylate isomerase [Rhodospirillales bacterium]
MAKHVDYYLSFTSPWTYLGSPEFGRICKDTGTSVNFFPCNFLEIFAATGGLPLGKRSPERQAYRLIEMERWGAWREMDINLKPAHWPFDETLAVGAFMAATEAGADGHSLSHAIMRSVWAEERDMADAGELKSVLEGFGLDSKTLLDKAADLDATRAIIRKNTEAAIAVGVFGAPSYLYENELFWGQDRLDFLERALRR